MNQQKPSRRSATHALGKNHEATVDHSLSPLARSSTYLLENHRQASCTGTRREHEKLLSMNSATTQLGHKAPLKESNNNKPCTVSATSSLGHYDHKARHESDKKRFTYSAANFIARR